jgi:hypothetical protein
MKIDNDWQATRLDATVNLNFGALMVAPAIFLEASNVSSG